MSKKQKTVQVIIGSGNKCVSIQGDTENKISLEKIIDNLYELFKLEDEDINAQIPDGILNVKTGAPAKFKSEKILSSLIKVGMPINTAIQTLEAVINELHTKVNRDHFLTTKEIRQYVADAIRRSNTLDVFDAEEWSYRYIRKYGHDNRRIVIYNYPEYNNVELSYSIIIEMIKAAFRELLPNIDVDLIGRQRYDNMASYVMEFVNGCDLYYFDYSILLSMVIEMARQPPHPWLITNHTKGKLVEYNTEAVESNIKQLISLNGHSDVLPSQQFYYYSEIIHHSSSLILERYQWFLGENDFSSFYILSDLISKYSSSEFSTIVQSNNAMQKLERDLVLAGKSLESFSKELSCIKKIIQSHKITQNNTDLILGYGKFALKLAKDCSIDTVINIFREDWSDRDSIEILNSLYTVLSTLVHASSLKKPSIRSNLFRFMYQNLVVNGMEIKSQYLVLYVDEKIDYSQINSLTANTYSNYASIILITSNNSNTLQQTADEIRKLTADSYFCVPFSKEDFVSILNSDNPAGFFYKKLSDWVF